MECDALLYCDFFELLVVVTCGDIGSALWSELKSPLISSLDDEEGGVGGKSKSIRGKKAMSRGCFCAVESGLTGHVRFRFDS